MNQLQLKGAFKKSLKRLMWFKEEPDTTEACYHAESQEAS